MWDLLHPGIEPVSLALAGIYFNHWATRDAWHDWMLILGARGLQTTARWRTAMPICSCIVCSCFLLQGQSWVLPSHTWGLLIRWLLKPIYWYWVVAKKSVALSQGRARMGSSCSKNLNSLMTFREPLLLTSWWGGNRVKSFRTLQSLTFWFQPVQVYVLVVSMPLTSSTWWGFSICRTTQGHDSGYYL